MSLTIPAHAKSENLRGITAMLAATAAVPMEVRLVFMSRQSATGPR